MSNSANSDAPARPDCTLRLFNALPEIDCKTNVIGCRAAALNDHHGLALNAGCGQ